MLHPSRFRPSFRPLLAGLLAMGIALSAPMGAWAVKGCAEGLYVDNPIDGLTDNDQYDGPPPSNLWGEIQPVGHLLDATRWTGSQLPTTSYPVTTAIDIENGFIFHSFYGGLSIWDARSNPAAPSRLSMVGGWEGGFPSWPRLTEFTQIVFYIDAPAGDDTIAAVGAITPVGLTIWDTSNKTSPRALYQDTGKFSYQLYAAKIGGRDYAFVADFQNSIGLHFYDMTAARSRTSSCVENTTNGENSCGVYRGRIGAQEAAKYVHGLAVGNRHFIVRSGGSGTRAGVEILDVTNPAAAQPVVQDFRGTGHGDVHGVALWTQGSRHYLGMRQNGEAKILDVTTCLTTGCQGLQNLVIWSQPLKPYPESIYWLSTTFSRSGNTPFLYFGNHDPCRQGEPALQTEYLYEVTNAANPREVSPKGTMPSMGETVDYWSWYYSTSNKGFSHFGPRLAKFNGEYLYRAGATLFDVHKWTGSPSGPPVANFTWNLSEIYAGDTVTFSDISAGEVTNRQWTFPDSDTPSSTQAQPQVKFLSPGVKNVNLVASNNFGSNSKAQNVTVLDPAPAVASVTVSPASPLVCQPVTFTANGVTGKPTLAKSWDVKNSGSTTVASQANAGNSFVWDTRASQSPAGTYTGAVTVANGSGSVTKSVEVTLRALTPLPASQSFAPNRDDFTHGTVQFRVDVSGATEWMWDFGDGTTPVWSSDPVTGPNPVHTYTSTGTKNVTVSVRNCVDTNGATSSPLQVNITQVAPLRIHSFQAQGCQIFCDFGPNQQLSFHLQVEGDPTSYEFDWNGNGFSNGADDQTSNTLSKVPGQDNENLKLTTHSYAVGTYLPAVRLRRGTEVTDWYVHQATINVHQGGGGGGGGGQQPSVTVAGPASGQINQAYNYTATAANCTPGTWTWSAGAGATITGSGASVSITWSSAGTKTVQATASGCTTGTRTVNITDPSSGGMRAEFTFTPANPAVNQAVSFDASSSTGNPVIYFWEFGDGASGYGATISHTFTSSGPRNVKLTVYKDCAGGNCTSQASTTKTLNVASGPQIVASFTTSATCTADLLGERCEVRVGDVVSFTSTTQGATSHSWSFNDGTPAVSGAQVSHAWTSPGTYLVQLMVSNGAASASTSRLFLVTGTPIATRRSVVLPWIAQTRGALVQSSDLYIHNPGSQAMDVTLEFRKRGTPETNPPKVTRTIQPGATLFSSDVLRDLFNKENVAGFITVDVDRGSSEPVITSFNTTFQANGQEFGQTVPGISMSRAGSAATSSNTQVLHLVGLNDNDDRVSYFGISNPGQDAVTYRLKFYDSQGRPLGNNSQQLTLSRFGQRQYQIREIRDTFGVSDADDYRIEIETTSDAQIFPYGANLRLGSDDPSFVGAGQGAAKSYLVGALSTRGLNSSLWQTDLVITNPSSEVVLVDVTFTSTGVNSQPTSPIHLTLQPGETRRLANVIDQQWNVNTGIGVLTLESNAPGGVYPIVQGESYENTQPARRFGQSMMGLTERQAAGPNQGQYLVGLRQDNRNRTTLWLFNPSGQHAEYDLIYRNLTGTEIGRTAGVRLAPGKMRQLSPNQHPLPAAGVTGGFTVQVLVKSGKVLSAAQVVNNVTNDPAYIQGETR